MYEGAGASFNLILRINKKATKLWLFRVFLMLLIMFLALRVMIVFGVGFFPRFIFFLLFLGLLPVALLILSYIGRLHFTRRHRLELNEDGLFDDASFCELGFVPIKSVAAARFSKLFGFEFLVIDFVSGENPLRKSRGLKQEIYRQFFGGQLWVPLVFFKVSKFDLESQLIHLGHLIRNRDPNRAAPPPKPPAPQPELEPIIPPPLNLKTTGKGLVERVSVPDPVPPPLSRISSEKERVLSQIDQIKQRVRESHFDQRVATLYMDHVVMFPAIFKNAPEHLPSGLERVTSMKEENAYEEVSFWFQGIPMTFGLRREIGGSNDESLLTIAVSGRVQMSLRVRIEIGELTPTEIESFLEGDWQQAVEGLSEAIAKREAERLGPLDVTEPMIALDDAGTGSKTIDKTYILDFFPYFARYSSFPIIYSWFFWRRVQNRFTCFILYNYRTRRGPPEFRWTRSGCSCSGRAPRSHTPPSKR